MLYIRTKYGDEYHVTEPEGNIIRLDQPGFKPSGDWKLLGIQHVLRSQFIPLNQLTDRTLLCLPLRYKNGNPQYTVRDLDHGSTRVWGHGIVAIQRLN